MNDSLYNQLESVQDLMVQKNYSEAIKRLEKLESRNSNNKRSLAYIFHTKAFVFYAQDDLENAKKSFYRSLDADQSDKKLSTSSYMALAQLELVSKSYKKALFIVEKLKENDENSFALYQIEAQIYLEQNEYKNAYEPLKKAVEIKKEITTMRALGAVCVELKKYNEAGAVFGEILKLDESSEADWLNLFYLHMMNNNEKDAIAVLTLAKSGNILDSKNQIIYAKALINSQIPMRSARLISSLLKDRKIERNRENLELLATSYMHAKEHQKAVDILVEIFEFDRDTKILEKAITVAYETSDFSRVVELGKKIDNLSDRFVFVLAISYYEIGKNKEARELFGKLITSKNYGKSASSWIAFIDK